MDTQDVQDEQEHLDPLIVDVPEALRAPETPTNGIPKAKPTERQRLTILESQVEELTGKVGRIAQAFSEMLAQQMQPQIQAQMAKGILDKLMNPEANPGVNPGV